MSKKNSVTECPVKKSLELINGKWTMYVIYQIGNETVRYGELKRKLEGISEKMFVNELKYLVEREIVHKTAYHEIPPRVEYSLTDKGKELFPIIEKLIEFGDKYL